MSRRKDAYVRGDSVAEIQDLAKIAIDNKDLLDDAVVSLKEKIDRLIQYIKEVREEFKRFLSSYGINSSYPEFSTVYADDIRQDTVAEQAVDVIPVETIFVKSFTDYTMNETYEILKDKYPTLQGPIEEYRDKLLKAKLHKALLENRLEQTRILQQEYIESIDQRKEDYELEKENLYRLRALFRNILQFRNNVFMAIPPDQTSERARNLSISRLGSDNALYASRRRSIKKMADKLNENFAVSSELEADLEEFKTLFKDVSEYFGSSDTVENPLPAQLVDGLSSRTEIQDAIEGYLTRIQALMDKIRVALDSIRGIRGLGNAMVESLIGASFGIAQSEVTADYIERTTFDEVTLDNQVREERVEQESNRLKKWLQTGVSNIQEILNNIQKGILRKTALVTGAPVEFVKDKITNLEDHLREDIRAKYGGDIRFCDEVIYIDITGEKKFVKETEIDPQTGKPRSEIQRGILLEETVPPRDIRSL